MAQADGYVYIDTKLDQSELNSGIGKMKSVVAAGVAAMVASIGALSVAVIKVGSEYENAAAKVSTLVDENVLSMNKLSTNMISVSNKTGQAASEIAEATYEALSAGISGTEDQITGFVEKTAKLAKAGFTTTASAVDVVTTAINGYGLSVEDADDIANQLIVTQNLGKTTVDELASSLGRVIPTASAFKVSLGNVNSAMAIMTASGIATAEATTYLKSMLNELGDTGSDVSAVLKEKTGKSFAELMESGMTLGDIMSILGESVNNDATAFANLWSSQEAGTGALSILNAGTEKFNSTLNQVENSTTAVDDAYAKVTDTFSEKSKKVQTSLKNVGIAAYEKFEEPLKGAMDAAQDAVNYLSKEMSNGKLGKSVDKIADSFSDLIKNTVQLASKAIPVVVNGFALLIDNSDKVAVGLAAISAAMIYQKNQTVILNTVKKASTAIDSAMTIASWAYEASQVALASGLGATGAAQAALNTVMAFSPIGATTLAVGALAAGVVALAVCMGDSTNAHKENMEAIQSEIDSYEELKHQQDEQLATNLGEITNVQSLSNELHNLVDANGKVKDGYEARANFIVGELNSALGLNMQLIDGEIKGYSDLEASIDDMIAKKKAEVILESQLPAYKEAVTNATKAQIEANKLEAAASKAKMEQKAIEAKLESKYGEDWFTIAYQKQDAMLTEWSLLVSDTKNKEDEYAKQSELVNGYYETIAGYETNATLLASGNAEAYKQIQTDILAKKAETVQGKISQIALEKDAEQKHLEYLQGELATATTEEQRKALQAQVENSQNIIKSKEDEMNGLTSTIINKGHEYNKATKNLALDALNEFKGDTQKYFDCSEEKFQKVIDGLNSKDPKVKKKAEESAKKMLDGLKSKDDEFSKAGANVLDGVINGSNSKAGNLYSTMANYGASMLKSFKDSLGIKSPSRAFAAESKFIPEGAAMGVEDNADVAIDSIERMSEDMLGAFGNPIDELLSTMDTSAIDSIMYDMQNAINLSQVPFNASAKMSVQHEVSKIDQDNATVNRIYKAALDGKIEVHVNIDGREAGIALAPIIAEELAFQ